MDIHKYLSTFIKDPKQIEKILKSKDVDIIFESVTGNQNILWDSKVFEKFKKIELSLEDGVIQCGKCKGHKVYSYTKQTRSGDESLTTFAFCSSCSSKWRINS